MRSSSVHFLQLLKLKKRKSDRTLLRQGGNGQQQLTTVYVMYSTTYAQRFLEGMRWVRIHE